MNSKRYAQIFGGVLLAGLLGVVLFGVLASQAVGAYDVGAQPMTATTVLPIPLPHDCDGFTPLDYPVPVCCVSGYVHYAAADLPVPQVAAGAVVTLTTASGLTATAVTTPGIHNPHGLAYYHFNLDELGAQPGEWITVTARYAGREASTRYLIHAGGQQVDVMLPESGRFDPVTVIVDDLDLVASPDHPGFHITPGAATLTEAACGAGAQFWDGVMYYVPSTASGAGPATITATYRPMLPVDGLYEVFAYLPYQCVKNSPYYTLHIPGREPEQMMSFQGGSEQTAGQWLSLGMFEFPAGSDSYVQVTDVSGRIDSNRLPLGIDAFKWELRAIYPPVATIVVDDLDVVATPGETGFYRNPGFWDIRTTEQGSLNPTYSIAPPLYWEDQMHWVWHVTTGTPQKWAQWCAALPFEGLYNVDVYIPNYGGGTRSARYEVSAPGKPTQYVTLNQAPQGGVWVPLGQYEFPAGEGNCVKLTDVTGEVSSPARRIVFDAVRWRLQPQFPPVAVIHHVAPRVAVQEQGDVVFTGNGMDTNAGAITGYRWVSDLDGLLATTATFSRAAADLTAGLHTLTFMVQDDEGHWSQPVETMLEVLPPGPAVAGANWHMMLYFAGDNNLSYHFSLALQRLEALSARENLTITVLFDRLGHVGVQRYLVQPNGLYTDGLNRWHLEELNTGDPTTLANYIAWAQSTYPAEHYYLAIANHGRGIGGIAWDMTSNDHITLPELREALHVGTAQGQRKIDVLHLDACLMGMVEVGYEVYPYADYLITSQNLAWAAFKYDAYAQALATVGTPREFAVRVAEIYHQQFHGHPYTISVWDLQLLPEVTQAVDGLAQALLDNLEAHRPALDTALAAVQRFDSQDYGRITLDDEFVDVRHLAELLQAQSADGAVQAAAQTVLDALQLSVTGVITRAVVYEHHASGRYGGHWWDVENAHGIALYFPPDAFAWDYHQYVAPVFRFSHDTQWDELLAAYLDAPDPPPQVPEEPGLPPVLELRRVFLPLVVRSGY